LGVLSFGSVETSRFNFLRSCIPIMRSETARAENQLKHSKDEAWTNVLARVRSKIDEQRFNLWFHNVELVRLSGKCAEIGVPNLFIRDWIQEHFLNVLEESFAEELAERPAVRLVINGKLFKKAREEQLTEGFDQIRKAITRSEAERCVQDKHGGVRPDLTLDSFVVGECNKLAHCCAMQVARSKESNFNPLFFHSVSGLGKTHLLQGIWHEIKAGNSKTKVAYTTAELFTNQFVYAMRNNKLDAFRHKYRNVEVLLLDDVHFFSNKLGLQEEFLHTYDALSQGRAQLVLASDVHPKMLSRLKESLASRFVSGMIVKLEEPKFETRVAILRAKAALHGRKIRRDVLEYIAHNFEGNVRALEGAITSVIAYAALNNSAVSVRLAGEALKGLIGVPRRSISLENIERAVAQQFGVSKADLRSRKRAKAVAFPRQICMYLARTLTDHSCQEIADYLGGRHHSTTVFAERKTRERLKGDDNLAELVAALKETVVRQQ